MNSHLLQKELVYKAVRSSGAGGQHVNKVSSKVILSFNVLPSEGLSVREKQLILSRLSTKLTKEGVLILQCSESRSQYQNKRIVTQRFFELLKNTVQSIKKRIPTKPSKASKKKRVDSKKRTSEKKKFRQKPNLD